LRAVRKNGLHFYGPSPRKANKVVDAVRTGVPATELRSSLLANLACGSGLGPAVVLKAMRNVWRI